MSEEDFDIRFVQSNSKGKGEIDTFFIIEYVEVVKCFTLFSDIFLTHILFEYDPEIGSFEFVYGSTGFQENLLQYLSDLFHYTISFLPSKNIIYIEHIIDMEDSNRTIFIYFEIFQTFFMIRKSSETIDFLVQCFIGFGNILAYYFETHYIADIVTLWYDKSPEPDKRPVFSSIAYIACPCSSGPDGNQKIIPKFFGLHSGTEYTHIFPDKFFSGVSGIF